MNSIDRLFDNLKEMIRDGTSNGQTSLDKLVSNIYMEIGDYHSEPDVYGLAMDEEDDDSEEEESFIYLRDPTAPEASTAGFEEYELCMKCQNSILMGTYCPLCREHE